MSALVNRLRLALSPRVLKLAMSSWILLHLAVGQYDHWRSLGGILKVNPL